MVGWQLLVAPVWKSVGAGLTGKQSRVSRQLRQETEGQVTPWKQNDYLL